MPFLFVFRTALFGADKLCRLYGKHRSMISLYGSGTYFAIHFITHELDKHGIDNFEAVANHFDMAQWIANTAATYALTAILIAEKIKAALKGPQHAHGNRKLTSSDPNYD